VPGVQRRPRQLHQHIHSQLVQRAGLIGVGGLGRIGGGVDYRLDRGDVLGRSVDVEPGHRVGIGPEVDPSLLTGTFVAWL
jgi:hypothetical protein